MNWVREVAGFLMLEATSRVKLNYMTAKITLFFLSHSPSSDSPQ